MAALFTSSDQFIWMGDLSYAEALHRQEAQYAQSSKPLLLGFEVSAPIITLGRSASLQTEVVSGNWVPWIATDRGGQATLHAPGQLVLFPVVNLLTHSIRPKDLVYQLLDVLQAGLENSHGLHLKNPGDGLYTEIGKLAFIGLRIRERKTFHGLSVNVCNDLALFDQIRSCGVAQARHDQISRVSPKANPKQVFSDLAAGTCRLTFSSTSV